MIVRLALALALYGRDSTGKCVTVMQDGILQKHLITNQCWDNHARRVKAFGQAKEQAGKDYSECLILAK